MIVFIDSIFISRSILLVLVHPCSLANLKKIWNENKKKYNLIIILQIINIIKNYQNY